MVKGEAAIEIFEGHKFIFTYDHMDELKEELNEKGKYHIYYVLKGHKYKIDAICILNRYDFQVEIRDCAENSNLSVQLNIWAFMQVPDLEYVDLKIAENGSVLQIDFTEKGMKFLQKEEPEYVKENRNIIEKYGHIRLRMHASFLRNLYFQFQEQETEEPYEVLYIGQTQKENIYDRLYSHNTIPEIVRDQNREENREKQELYIMVTGVHIKFFKEYNRQEYGTNMLLMDTAGDDFLINQGIISQAEVINLAEAMLILYFKPKYNNRLKDTKKPELLRTYRIFNDCLINPITYVLDLYFKETKQKMILKTDAVCTKYKQNLLKCEFTEAGEVKGIRLEEQEDDWYL